MEKEGKDDKNLTIVINTTRGSWKDATFLKTTKVQEVIQAVIQHFNFASNGNYEIYLKSDPNNPLKPERPLVSYGIKDGDVLVFTDLGVAV